MSGFYRLSAILNLITMKLHLPKGLRAALLAVFSFAPVSYAATAPAVYDYLVKTETKEYSSANVFVLGTTTDMSQNWHLTINAKKMWGEPCIDNENYTGGYSIFTNDWGIWYDSDDLTHGGWSSESSFWIFNETDFTIYMTPNGNIYYANERGHVLMGQDPQGFATQSQGITPFTINVMWEVNEDRSFGTLYYVGGSFSSTPDSGEGTNKGWLAQEKIALVTLSMTAAGESLFGTSSTSTETRPMDVEVTMTVRGSDGDPSAWQVTGTADLGLLKSGGEGGYLDVTGTTDTVRKLENGDAVHFIGNEGVLYTTANATYSNNTLADADVLKGESTRSVGFGAAKGATLTVERSALAQNVLSGNVMNESEQCGLRVVGEGTVILNGMKVGDKIHEVSIGSGSTLELASTGDVVVNLTRGVVGSDAKVTHSGSGDLTVNLDAEKSVALASLTNETTGTLNVGDVAGRGSLAAAVIDSKGAVTINAATTAAELSSTGNLEVSGSLTAAKTTVGGKLTVDAGATMTATQSLDITGKAEISGALSASGLSIKADSVTVTGSTGSLSAKAINAASVTAASGVTISQSPVSTLSSTESTALLSGNVVVNKDGIIAGSIASGSEITFDSTSTGTVTAGAMENVSVEVDSVASVTGASSTAAVSMSAAGMSTAGTLTADEVELKTGSSYAIQAGKLEAAELTAGDTTIEAAAGDTITITNLNKLSATEIDAGHIEADSVEIAGGYTVKNATIAADTKLGSNVQLQNVSFAGALKTSGDFALDETKFAGGGGYESEAGTYKYTVGADMDSVVLSGNQVGAVLQLSGLVVNAEGVDFSGTTVDAPRTKTVLTADIGTITPTAAYTEQLNIAPYVRAEVAYDPTTATITGYDDEENIKQELVTSSNRTAAMEAINQVEDTVDAGSPMKVLRDNLGHIYRASQQEREQLLSAISGASTTVLADSQRRGLRDVQHNLRNRIIQMGGGTNAGIINDWEYAGIQAWAQADAGFSTTDGSGDECGYDFNTTGATVGANLDLTANLVVGMSFSASYGELEVDGADHASGNNDTYYLSLFARHQSKRWVQMLILTAGLNQMDLERRVGGFQAEGETEGSSLSAYYEVGYTCALDYDYNHIIQPLVNISFTSAKVDGYKETGSIGNAGLDYDSAEYFYGQVGIGARYQGVLYESVHERCAVIEARAMLTQDFGDATDEAEVALIAGGNGYKVKGVDSTGTGFEVGVGLSIPVEQHTTLFADADLTYAPDYMGFRANVGLRYDF